MKETGVRGVGEEIGKNPEKANGNKEVEERAGEGDSGGGGSGGGSNQGRYEG